MQKETLHDLIERYLNDDVTEAERQQVVSLIATDRAFRASLEFQRAMHLHLGDPVEMQLHAALDDILQIPGPEGSVNLEKPSPKSKNSGGLALGGALLLLVAGIAIWYFMGIPQPVSVEPPPSIQPTPKEPIAQNPPAPTMNPSEELPERPIAMANPKDFKPNPALEALIGTVRGGADVEISFTSPKPDAVLYSQNGKVTLLIKGTLNADSMALRQPLRMLIYSNSPQAWENKQALSNLQLPFELAGEGEFRVDVRQGLSLRPGLYYAVAGRERPVEKGGGYRTLWVGKFSVK